MVASVRSQTPTRLPGGSTTDAPYGPLADSGYGNPVFYHQFYDDFDNTLTTGATGLYTQTATGGTFSHVAGDGGIAQISIPATNNDLGYIQLPAASFQLPQGTTYPTGTLGKKLFYGVRLTGISTIASYTAILGLCDTTATLFTSITDGVYFSLTGSVVSFVTASGGTTLTWTIPAADYTLAAATQLDLAFYMDWYQNLNVFIGPQLFGFIPQSGSGSVSSTTGVSLLPDVGRSLQVIGPNFQPQSGATGLTGPWTVSSANLNPTIGIKATAATAVTLQVDFQVVQKER
jgi:hypothetical protein